MSTATSVPQRFHFDAKAAQQLSMLYMTDDIKEMQRQYRVWFDPKPGEQILDAGCGTGVNSLAIAKLAGPSGKVLGIDNSEAMLKLAREKASAENVEYQQVSIEEAQLQENSFDGVVCTQVLSYLPEPEAAIGRMLRWTKPGGRLFIAETDWDTLVYSIPDKDLQRKVVESFSDHLGDGWVGRRLYTWCRQAGARDVELYPYIIWNAEYSIRKYGGPLSYIIRDNLLRSRAMPEPEVRRWLQQLSDAYDNRTYFFAQTRLVCILRK